MKQPEHHYENNPIMIGLDGIKLFFTRSRGTAIYSVVATIVLIVATFAFFASMIGMALSMGPSEIAAMDSRDQAAWNRFWSPQSPADVVVPIAREVGLQFVSLVFGLLVFGVLDYAAARNARGKDTDLGEAFKVVLTRFPGYLWTYIVMTLKLVGWTLLLVVPGIIMFYRYIFTGMLFFAEDKVGHAASKRSAELTKGRWVTTFAGTSIWPVITQGLGFYVFIPGSLAVLYRQYVASDERVKPHWLSWTLLATILTLIMLFFVLIAVTIMLAASLPTAP